MSTKTNTMPLVHTLWTPGEMEKRPNQNTQLTGFTAIAPINQAPTAYVADEQDADLYCQSGNMFRLLLDAIRRVEMANQDGDPILSAWLPDAVECIRKANGGVF